MDIPLLPSISSEEKATDDLRDLRRSMLGKDHDPLAAMGHAERHPERSLFKMKSRTIRRGLKGNPSALATDATEANNTATSGSILVMDKVGGGRFVPNNQYCFSRLVIV
jgi:hypothetical protein